MLERISPPEPFRKSSRPIGETVNTSVKWIAPCLIVLLGAIIGLELGRRLGDHAATLARSDLQLSERDRIAIRALNRSLKADHAALSEAMGEPDPAVAVISEPGPGLETIDRLKQLQQMNVAVRVTAVQRGTIYPGFAALFGLTEAEVARLNDALRQAHAEVNEPTVTAANVSRVKGAVVVQVPASEDGQRQRQKLLDEFAATLGPERFAALTSMAGTESIDREFDAFGGTPRQITIMRTGPEQLDAPAFRMMVGRLTSTGSSISTIYTFSDPGQLPEKYRWLIPILPPLTDLQPPTGSITLTPSVEKK
jgi:hypothetical protein